jgi:hypothetical protein
MSPSFQALQRFDSLMGAATPTARLAKFLPYANCDFSSMHSSYLARALACY